MRRLVFAFVAVCSLAVASPALAADATVRITKTGFEPASVTVERGDAVIWRNVDSIDHQVVGDGGSFQSPMIPPGRTYSFEFTRAGTFSYHDTAATTLRKGAVVVRPVAERSVTIDASQTVVTMGEAVTLAGSVSTAEPGESVRVVGASYRGGTIDRTVQTDAEGDWHLVVRPQIRTEYRVVWRGVEGPAEPVVHVRPRVGLGLVGARPATLFTRVTALYSYRGKRVTVQRRLADGRWVPVRRVVLGRGSSARFTVRLPGGTSRVRVVVPSSPGYLAGQSRTVLVSR